MSEDARGNKLELDGLVADYRATGLNVNETEGNTLALQETNFGPRNGEISGLTVYFSPC